MSKQQFENWQEQNPPPLDYGESLEEYPGEAPMGKMEANTLDFIEKARAESKEDENHLRDEQWERDNL